MVSIRLVSTTWSSLIKRLSVHLKTQVTIAISSSY
ncbi:hypothetical protein KS872_004687 [Vibrio parahaemolyticus]|nr:hypothetical protein [Vibrio parahaemolyticus]EHT4943610.1 hypothetical protein [Vibrio vulnificus]EKO3594189.1 hypothetical protein [Vibrio metschnikovii]ELB2737673.1 hypothetical protein [Vibrio alginolyticus]EIV8469499.1 hypothetical protein [Vibrio vulnificus]